MIFFKKILFVGNPHDVVAERPELSVGKVALHGIALAHRAAVPIKMMYVSFVRNCMLFVIHYIPSCPCDLLDVDCLVEHLGHHKAKSGAEIRKINVKYPYFLQLMNFFSHFVICMST